MSKTMRAVFPILAISVLLLMCGCSGNVAGPATDDEGGTSPDPTTKTVATPSGAPELDLTSSEAWKVSCRLTEAQVDSALAPYGFKVGPPSDINVNAGDNECAYQEPGDSIRAVGIRIREYGAGTRFGTSGDTELKWTADSSAQGATSACTAYGQGAVCEPAPGGLMVISAGGTDGAAFPDGAYFYTFTIYGVTRDSKLQPPAEALAADLLALGPIVP